MNNIVIIQPALPSYRIDFFRRLAAHYGRRLHVYYSPATMDILTANHEAEDWEHLVGALWQPVPGVEWQVGAFSVPFCAHDIVVVCGAPRNLSTLLLLVRARMRGATTIWWGQYWSSTSKRYRHYLRLKMSRLADAILFYTDSEIDRFREDGWTHQGQIGALNNGIDLTAVRNLRKPYDLVTRGRNLLFIGRLTDKAALPLAIRALSEPSMQGVHLHVIGGGSIESDLRAFAAACGVADQITWYGGTINESKIAEIANRCSAFLYPGQVGLSLIHAMGYGLPSIVHDQHLRHMPEIAAFEDGVTGVTFHEGRSRSLAEKASWLLREPVVTAKMSERCVAVTEHEFTTEGMAKRFIEFVDQLATRCQ